MAFKFTVEQQAELREYAQAMNQKNWGTWPDAEKWPVPIEAGGFTVSQYQGTRKSDIATILKFDRAVILADGTRAKRVGCGAIRGVPDYCKL